MRTLPITPGAPVWPTPSQVPILEAGDLPGDEDWAVLESLRFGRGLAEADADADRFDEVQVMRGAFE
jgi:hypothetical protein